MDQPITIPTDDDQARALHWFVRHINFTDAFESTPPHLPAADRRDRAYIIMQALGLLELALIEAGAQGDSWMYRHTEGAT